MMVCEGDLTEREFQAVCDLAASAYPRPEKLIRVDEHGNESPGERPRKPDVSRLKSRLWAIAGYGYI